MATFTYKAKTSNGQTITGVLTAESQQAALRTLDERALFPISVSEGGQAAKTVLPGRKRRLKLRVLTGFYSQLSDLLRAGVPVLRALDVLGRQSANPLLSEILKEVHADVSGGETLAEAMAKHPNAFNNLAVAMVRAGEQGGFLEDVLTRISIFTEKQDELKNKLIGSMIYPCVLMGAGVIVVSFLMAYVVPQIRGLLDRVEKPWLTTVVFALSDFVRADGLYVLGAIVVGVALLVPMLRSERGQEVVDNLKLRAPVMGPIIKMVAICRFCRILGTMLHNGVPILAALKISKDSAGSRDVGGTDRSRRGQCTKRGDAGDAAEPGRVVPCRHRGHDRGGRGEQQPGDGAGADCRLERSADRAADRPGRAAARADDAAGHGGVRGGHRDCAAGADPEDEHGHGGLM